MKLNYTAFVKRAGSCPLAGTHPSICCTCHPKTNFYANIRPHFQHVITTREHERSINYLPACPQLSVVPSEFTGCVFLCLLGYLPSPLQVVRERGESLTDFLYLACVSWDRKLIRKVNNLRYFFKLCECLQSKKALVILSLLCWNDNSWKKSESWISWLIKTCFVTLQFPVLWQAFLSTGEVLLGSF